MVKKRVWTLLILLLVFVLAACSSLNLPGVNSQPTNAANQRGQFTFDLSKMPVENKLAIGILKLEGTNLAVTKDEAKTLLPLWQAVKSLRTSNNTSTEEVNGLFSQIKDAMTPDQVAAIQKLNMNQNDLRAMMTQYGVQQGQGGFANLSPDQRATRVAQFQAQGGNRNGGSSAGGNFTGGGGFQGGGGIPGVNQGQQGTVRRTPAPGQTAQRRNNAGGLNYLFVDAIIKLLQQRAG